MKPDLTIKTSSLLILTSFLLWGCQKASEPVKPKTKSLLEAAKPETMPDQVCSSELSNLLKDLIETQKQTHDLFKNSDPLKSRIELKHDSLKMGDKQLEMCKAIQETFDTEKIESCLGSSGQKSQENVYSKTKIQSSCKEVSIWIQKMKKQGQTEAEKVSVASITFTQESRNLIQGKSSSDYIFISEGQINIGSEKLKSLLKDSKQACIFISTSNRPVEELHYEFTAENQGGANAIGLDHKGQSSSFFFQDSKNEMISLICLNLDLTTEKNKVLALQKVFDTQIKVSAQLMSNKIKNQEDKKQDLAESKERLNQDVPPTPAKAGIEIKSKIVNPVSQSAATASTSGTGSVAEIESTIKPAQNAQDAVQEIVDKAKATVNEIVKESLDEVKKTTGEVTTQAIQETQKATVEVSNHVIAETKKASQQVISQSIVEAKKAATEVVDQSIEKGKKAANEVVDHAIGKGKSTLVEAVKAPYHWAVLKTTDAFEFIGNLFESKSEPETKVEPKAEKKLMGPLDRYKVNKK